MSTTPGETEADELRRVAGEELPLGKWIAVLVRAVWRVWRWRD